MQVEIINPGLFATVQDLGREDYRWQAVPVSGAMDTLSARLANKTLGNDAHDAVIEFTYAGASFKTNTHVLIAYAGTGANFIVGDQLLKSNRPVFLPAGSIVSLRNNTEGSRSYLAIAGGWNVPEVLGSRSTYVTAGIGGVNGRVLQTGDILNARYKPGKITTKIYQSLKGNIIKHADWNLLREVFLPADPKKIRVVPGPEFIWFNSDSLIGFLSKPFTLSQKSNRMGYQLQGQKLRRRIKDELLSTAVAPGTIQVTNNGDMIMLMADCQTTGGYPRIAQVAAVDLPLCGQLKPGDTIHFTEIGRHEAEMLYLEREQQLGKLAFAIKNRYL